MKYTILMGSPRRDGNTAALLQPFLEENQEMGIEQDVIWLYDRDIKPCIGCKTCEKYCPQNLPIAEHIKTISETFDK